VRLKDLPELFEELSIPVDYTLSLMPATSKIRLVISVATVTDETTTRTLEIVPGGYRKKGKTLTIRERLSITNRHEI
jgi:hypothetical protein